MKTKTPQATANIKIDIGCLGWQNRLMVNVLVVGLRPSKPNVDPRIPLLGTKGYNTLIKWMDALNVGSYGLINISTRVKKSALTEADIDGRSVKEYAPLFDKVIAVGGDTSYWLSYLNIEHYMIPHPASKSKFLNDKNYIKEMLLRTRDWLADGS